MDRLRKSFERAISRIKHPDHKVVVPMAYIERLFRFNNDAYVQNSYFQTMINFGLGINDMNCPAQTHIYQTNPRDRVFVTIKADPHLADSDGEVRSFPASPMIVKTDFRLSMLSQKRGIGILIRPRLENAMDDITVAFGLYGTYDPKDRGVTIKKLMLLDPKTDEMITPQIREETVMRALEFARLCIEQQFDCKAMKLNQNMHMATMLQEADLKAGWKNTPAP